MKFNIFNKLTEDPKYRRRIITGAVLILFLSFMAFSDHGLLKRLSLKLENRELQSKIDEQNLINDSLSKRIQALQVDTLEIEKIAREKYGMVKPGETVILVPSKMQNKEE